MLIYNPAGKFEVIFPQCNKLEAIKFVREFTGNLITAKSVVEGALNTISNNYELCVDYQNETSHTQYAVAGDNVVLGVYPTMNLAIESLKQSVEVMRPVQETETYAEYDCEYHQSFELRNVNGERICTKCFSVNGTFTITAVRSATVAGPLFKS